MPLNTDPVFGGAPICKVAAVSTANTNRDGTGTIVDILTAGAEGCRIEEIVVKATANPADSTVTIFIHNGTSYFIFDEIDLGDPAAGSATVESHRASRTYDNLVLEAGHKLAAAITAALTAGVMNVWALGADLAAE